MVVLKLPLDIFIKFDYFNRILTKTNYKSSYYFYFLILIQKHNDLYN